MHVGNERSDTYISVLPETLKIVPLHNHYFVESPVGISGARFRMDIDSLRRILPTKTIWLHHEAFEPDFLKAEGFNEAYRLFPVRTSWTL
jgi:hypothetical protein